MTSKIADHVDLAVDRLTDESKTDNRVAFISALVRPLQDIEDAAYQLLTERGIYDAIGQQLDDLGEIVKEPRNGLSDDDYRIRLFARVAANNSEGLLSDFIKVARLIFNDDTLTARIEPQYPAALVLHVEGGPMSEAAGAILIEFLKDTRSGGVGIQAHFHIGEDEDTFELGSVTHISSATVPIGSTAVPVLSTDGFATSGSIILGYLDASQETWAYTSKDATNFYGAATVNTHSLLHEVKTANSSTQGTGDTGSPSVGGELSSVLD